MKLRPFSWEEFREREEEFVQIYFEAYQGLERYAYRSPKDVRRYLRWLHRVDPQGLIGTERGEEVIGFVFFCRHWWDKRYGEVGEIHELVVLPHCQRQGVGTALLGRALEVMREDHRVFGLWVGEENEVAKGFYLKRGFSVQGQMGKWIRMIKRE